MFLLKQLNKNDGSANIKLAFMLLSLSLGIDFIFHSTDILSIAPANISFMFIPMKLAFFKMILFIMSTIIISLTFFKSKVGFFYSSVYSGIYINIISISTILLKFITNVNISIISLILFLTLSIIFFSCFFTKSVFELSKEKNLNANKIIENKNDNYFETFVIKKDEEIENEEDAIISNYNFKINFILNVFRAIVIFTIFSYLIIFI